MKIAIPSTSESENGQISPTFARAGQFVIKNTETGETEILKNPYITGRGVGFAVAELLANKGVNAVIAETIGPNAVTALREIGIKVYQYQGSVKEAIEKAEKGELNEINMPVPPRGFGMRGRAGFGFGRRGMGRGWMR